MLTSFWPVVAAASFFGALACALAGIRSQSLLRTAWFVLAAGLGLGALRWFPAIAGSTKAGSSTASAAMAIYAVSALLLGGGFLLYGFLTRTRRTKSHAFHLADFAILSLALCVVGWCIVAPASGAALSLWPLSKWPSSFLPLLVSSGVFAAALLSRVGSARTGQTAWLIFEAAAAGAALFWAEVVRSEAARHELARRVASAARATPDPLDSLLPILAPLLIALAAGLTAFTVVQDAADEAGEGRAFQSGLQRIEIVALMLLPGAAMIMPLFRGRSGHETALAAVLATIALARLGMALWKDSLGTVESENSSSSDVTRLQRQLARRTHQLTTLHAVTADLNNTLDVEKLLNSALDSVCDAVQASSAAIWLRLDDANLAGSSPAARRAAGVGSPEMKPVGSAAVLLRELERSAAERRALERLQEGDDGTDDNHVIKPAVQWVGRRWRMVQTRGESGEMLQTLHDALELGDMTAAAEACRSRAPLAGSGHIAAVRWKGEIIGALGVLSPHRGDGTWDDAERGLVDALALEVGAALRNAQLYQDASRQVDRDSLTDLLNHRALQGQLGAHLSRAQRTKMDFSVVLMDVKNFKFFNDTYGHHIGDQVLRTVARCLTEATRTSDVLGRFGGDEFMAILLDTDSRGTIEVCQRIKQRVEREAFQESNDGRRIPIALSFGASMFPDDGKSVMDLIGGAQTQLESAKYGDAPMLGNLQKSAGEEAQEMRKLREASEGGSFGVLDALVTAIDNKDHYTRRHSEDVTHWATLMGKQLEFSDETQRAVRIAGLLHDVGKIAVPDSILRKPGRLNDEEFQIMQQHPSFGALIVKEVPHLTEVLGGIRHHHERYDGKGYPDKLAGENIPLLGRLLAVPDCFSAMTTERPYRKAMTWAESIAEIEKGRGTQFDPAMADAFLEVIARLITEKEAPAPHVAPDEEAFTNLRPRSVADMEIVA
ncbi:MAG TPA: HD domain-containing phosphohydrolase [Abditibacteriaceae bacterium]